MTAQEFKELTKQDPIQDDLARANCKDAGKIGHYQCGICPICGYPIFMVTIKCNHTGILSERLKRGS